VTRFHFALIILALLAFIAMSCSSGDGALGGGGGAPPFGTSDRGPLVGDPTTTSDPGSGERGEVQQFRDASFRQTNSGYVTSQAFLPEDRSLIGTIFERYVGRLHWSAIHHTGYLASITDFATAPDSKLISLNKSVLFPAQLAEPPYVWSLYNNTEADSGKRYALNNAERDFSLQLATNTGVPPVMDPVIPPRTPATPWYRLIVRAWNREPASPNWWVTFKASTPLPRPDMPTSEPFLSQFYSVHEYYIREPFIPDNFGSRTLSAFYSRYGRLGMIRNQHVEWGFGSILDARSLNLMVPLEGTGDFLQHLFRGTFIYLIDGTLNLYRSSIWPGGPISAPGRAPIAYGWGFDPENGTRTGLVIHVASTGPVGAVGVLLEYARDATRPIGLDPSFPNPLFTITATNQNDPSTFAPDSDLNFGPNYIVEPPAFGIYPIHFNAYTSNGAVVFSLDPTITVIDAQFVETSYLKSEVFLVPVLKAEWSSGPGSTGALPPGAYRLTITGAGSASGTWLFYVWNQTTPSFFRP